MTYGSGKYQYELADWHAKFPLADTPIEINGLAVDSKDRLFTFNTGKYSAAVFDSEGNLLTSWPEKYFTHTHGCCIGPDDSIYVADDGNSTVTKYSPEGKLLMTLGTKNKPTETGFTTIGPDGKRLNIFEAIATTKHSGPPFNAPTDVSLSKSGEIFVSDGYGNARVHKFSADGKLQYSWGDPGKGPSQFVVPHAVAVDKRGRVLVADRHNNRIQVFDAKGKFIAEWGNLNLPTDVFVDKDDTFYVSELMPAGISIFNNEGKRLARWGNEGRTEADPLFVTLHTITVDSHGNIYVGEVMGAQKGTPFLETRKTRMIQKFIRK